MRNNTNRKLQDPLLNPPPCLELPFGSMGKVSGRAISQLSPFIYIFLGNAHPLLNVNDFMSFSNNISVVTEPTCVSPALSMSLLQCSSPQKRLTSSAFTTHHHGSAMSNDIYYINTDPMVGSGNDMEVPGIPAVGSSVLLKL